LRKRYPNHGIAAMTRHFIDYNMATRYKKEHLKAAPAAFEYKKVPLRSPLPFHSNANIENNLREKQTISS